MTDFSDVERARELVNSSKLEDVENQRQPLEQTTWAQDLFNGESHGHPEGKSSKFAIGPNDIWYPENYVPKEAGPSFCRYIPPTPEPLYKKGTEQDSLRSKVHPLYPKLWRGNHVVYDRYKELPFHEVQKECPPSLSFESRFECGNLRQARRIGQFEYELLLQTDLYVGRHTQWYYFRIGNMLTGITYRFNITNLLKQDSLYNYGMMPLMYSTWMANEKNVGWTRNGHSIRYFRNFKTNSMSSKKYITYTLTFQLEFPQNNDLCFLAHSYPYTFSNLLSDLDNYCFKHPIVCRREVLCKTLAGNDCPLLTITSSKAPEGQKKKSVVVLSARVHPGESNSSWIMKGILDYLSGGGEKVEELCHDLLVVIIPMLNPDGVVVGNYRCSLAGKDLNRSYLNPNKELHPTVWYTKELIKQLNKKYEVILYCDIHGHSRMSHIFMYGCHEGLYRDAEDLLHQRLLPWMLSKQAKETFSFRNCNFSISKSKETTARVVIWRELGIANSFTLEASFCGTRPGNSARHFTVQDLEETGKQFCISLLDLSQIYDSVVGRNEKTERYYSKLCKMACAMLKHFQKLEEDSSSNGAGDSDHESMASSSANQEKFQNTNARLPGIQRRAIFEQKYLPASDQFCDAIKSSATVLGESTNKYEGKVESTANSRSVRAPAVSAGTCLREDNRELNYRRTDNLVRQLLKSKSKQLHQRQHGHPIQRDNADSNLLAVPDINTHADTEISDTLEGDKKAVNSSFAWNKGDSDGQVGLSDADSSLESEDELFSAKLRYLCKSGDTAKDKEKGQEEGCGQVSPRSSSFSSSDVDLNPIFDRKSDAGVNKKSTKLVGAVENAARLKIEEVLRKGRQRTLFQRQLQMARQQQKYRAFNESEDQEQTLSPRCVLPFLASSRASNMTKPININTGTSFDSARERKQIDLSNCEPKSNYHSDVTVYKPESANDCVSQANATTQEPSPDLPVRTQSSSIGDSILQTFTEERNRKPNPKKLPVQELFERALAVLNKLDLHRIDEQKMSSESDSETERWKSGRSSTGRRHKVRKSSSKQRSRVKSQRPKTAGETVAPESAKPPKARSEVKDSHNRRSYQSRSAKLQSNKHLTKSSKEPNSQYIPKVYIKKGRDLLYCEQKAKLSTRSASVTSKDSTECDSSDNTRTANKNRASSVPSIFEEQSQKPRLESRMKSLAQANRNRSKILEDVGRMRSCPLLPKLYNVKALQLTAIQQDKMSGRKASDP